MSDIGIEMRLLSWNMDATTSQMHCSFLPTIKLVATASRKKISFFVAAGKLEMAIFEDRGTHVVEKSGASVVQEEHAMSMDEKHRGTPTESLPSVENDATSSSSGYASDEDADFYPEGGLSAWLVVLGSFSAMVACFGLMNTIGTFQAYLTTHQLRNFDQGTIAWIFSLYVFLAFFSGVQIGPIFDAKGPRILVLAGSAFLLASMMLLGACHGRLGQMVGQVDS